MAFGVHANGRCLLTLAADIDGARWILSNQNRNELRRDAGLVAKMLDRRRDIMAQVGCALFSVDYAGRHPSSPSAKIGAEEIPRGISRMHICIIALNGNYFFREVFFGQIGIASCRERVCQYV